MAVTQAVAYLKLPWYPWWLWRPSRGVRFISLSLLGRSSLGDIEIGLRFVGIEFHVGAGDAKPVDVGSMEV